MAHQIWGLDVKVQDLVCVSGFRVQVLGFRSEVSGFRFEVLGFRF